MRITNKILSFVLGAEILQRKRLGWDDVDDLRSYVQKHQKDIIEHYRSFHNTYKGRTVEDDLVMELGPFFTRDMKIRGEESTLDVSIEAKFIERVDLDAPWVEYAEPHFSITEDGRISIYGKTYMPEFVVWDQESGAFTDCTFENYDSPAGSLSDEWYDRAFPKECRLPNHWITPDLSGPRADNAYQEAAEREYPSLWNDDLGLASLTEEQFYTLYTEAYNSGNIAKLTVLSITVGVNMSSKQSHFDLNMDVEYSTTGREDIFNPTLFFIALRGYCESYKVTAEDFVSAFNLEMNSKGISVKTQHMSVGGVNIDLSLFFASHKVSTRQILRIGAFQAFLARKGKSYLGDGLYLGMEFDCLMTLEDQREYFISMVVNSSYEGESDVHVLGRISHARNVLQARGLEIHDIYDIGQILLPYTKKSHHSLEEVVEGLEALSAKMGELSEFLSANGQILKAADTKTRSIVGKDGVALVAEIRKLRSDILGVQMEHVRNAVSYLKDARGMNPVSEFQDLLYDELSSSIDESN